MSKRKMQYFKIRNAQHARTIQKQLFNLGYVRYDGSQEILREPRSPYIVIHSNDEQQNVINFTNSKNIEGCGEQITLDDTYGMPRAPFVRDPVTLDMELGGIAVINENHIDISCIPRWSGSLTMSHKEAIKLGDAVKKYLDC